MNDNYLVIDPGGESYFYGSHLSSGCVPRFNVTMTFKINGDILHQTMQEILKRFPQMAVGIERLKNKYALKAISSEFPVYHDDGNTVRTIGGKETNGYLFLVSYFGKRITFDFLHVLGDGTGFIIFIKSVIFRYLQLSNFPVKNDGTILTVDQPYSFGEGENAISKIMNIKGSIPSWYESPAEAFQVPDISTENDPSDTIVEIRIPFNKLYGVTKKYQSSPVTFIEPLFSQAIYEKYKSEIGDNPIVASIPVNLRPFFPSETTRYFIAVAALAHGKIFLQEDFPTMLLTQKKMLKEQTKPEFLACMAQRQATGMSRLTNLPNTIEEKIAIMDKSIISSLRSYTYIITNMGHIAMPESIGQYIREFFPVLPAAITPFTIAATTWKNEFILSISQRSEDTSICTRFVELLNKFNMFAYISDKYSFHTMKFFPL